MKKKRHTIHRHGTLNPARLGLCLKTEQQKEQIERSIFAKLIQKQFPHHYKLIIKMSGKQVRAMFALPARIVSILST